jgi:hypothetical protein
MVPGMAIESKPYYFAVCDECGEVADYGDWTAWSDPGQAVDMALELEWSDEDGKLLCPDHSPPPADG